MSSAPDKNDHPLLELLRQTGGLSIQELMERLAVTATAVRQRLDRLCAAGLVEKEEIRVVGRGRPSHRYSLSESGLRALDRNMVELAKVVWDEIQAIDDQAVRNYLLGRISKRLAAEYGQAATAELGSLRVRGIKPRYSTAPNNPAASQTNSELTARLERLAETLRERQFPVIVEQDPSTMLPILKINGCPYPELSDKGHNICEVEEAMFSQLLGDPVKLRHCRCDSPDGGCVFDVVSAGSGVMTNSRQLLHPQQSLSQSSSENLASGTPAN
jgi:predicted ArsR family transcriptional regulator